MSVSLKGRTAIITGASSGIGRAVALALAHEGCKVAIAARRQDKLDELKQEIEKTGGVVLVKQTDVVNRQQVKDLVAETIKTFGHVDILINNAGIMPLTLLKNLHEDEWEKTIDVNVKGVLNGIGAVLPHMLERNSGDIINISSDAGRKVFSGGAIYCGSKWALEAITQGLRLETEGTKIRVTSIQPGGTYSELGNSITDSDPILKKNGEEYMSKVQKLLAGEDIARAVVYAATQPENCAINEILVRPTNQRN
eukprot:TRINITY_DN3750_c0_g1_i1.p1 TRINITY_DN3750_c0_g1~~TRINITY_DN3750_c0_g1_i1.p1  ORF type:complete len:253 (-),score=85.50 TRINITY_DN3750_c0_g1_i1:89-847(-)